MVDFTRHVTSASGLYFPEGLRWHDGSLWFSDVFGGTVICLGSSGPRVVAHVPGMPSGLGWLPDGTLLVVSMQRKAILSIDSSGAHTMYADLREVCPEMANDMTVDRLGRAYVGNYGYDVDNGAPLASTHLVRVDPDRSVHIEAPEVIFPNGCALTDGGQTLVLAETFADRLSAFPVGINGSLGERRTVAQLPAGVGPDGISVEPSGRVWVACAFGERVLAVDPDGRIADQVGVPGVGVYSCAVGGDDAKTLFIALAPLDEAEAARHPSARIVAVPL